MVKPTAETSAERDGAGMEERPFPGLATLTEILAAHSRLLTAYFDVVREASLRAPNGTGFATLRRDYVVRKLTQGHVRGRVRHLAGIYGQMAAVAERPLHRERLEEAEKSCRSFAASLSTSRAATAVALLPAVVGLAGPAINQISVPRVVIIFLGVPLLWAAYQLIHVGMDFERKRELFAPTAATEEKNAQVESPPAGQRNIYLLEETLFGRLGRGKPVEAPLDVAFEGLGFITAVIAVAFQVSDMFSSVLVTAGGCLLVVIGASFRGVFVLERRRWR